MRQVVGSLLLAMCGSAFLGTVGFFVFGIGTNTTLVSCWAWSAVCVYSVVALGWLAKLGLWLCNS